MKLPLNYGEAYRSKFESVYSELAQAHRLTLMPFFLEGVGAQTTLNQADGIHPTGNGYRVVVNNLWPVLKPLLRKDSEHSTQGDKAAATRDRYGRNLFGWYCLDGRDLVEAGVRLVQVNLGNNETWDTHEAAFPLQE